MYVTILSILNEKKFFFISIVFLWSWIFAIAAEARYDYQSERSPDAAVELGRLQKVRREALARNGNESPFIQDLSKEIFTLLTQGYVGDPKASKETGYRYYGIDTKKPAGKNLAILAITAITDTVLLLPTVRWSDGVNEEMGKVAQKKGNTKEGSRLKEHLTVIQAAIRVAGNLYTLTRGDEGKRCIMLGSKRNWQKFKTLLQQKYTDEFSRRAYIISSYYYPTGTVLKDIQEKSAERLTRLLLSHSHLYETALKAIYSRGRFSLSSSFKKLPSELSTAILFWLDMVDLKNLRHTCTAMKDLITKEIAGRTPSFDSAYNGCSLADLCSLPGSLKQIGAIPYQEIHLVNNILKVCDIGDLVETPCAHSLTTLNISSSKYLTATGSDVSLLVEALKKFTKLDTLIISRSSFDIDRFKILFSGLDQLPTLTALDMGDTGITNETIGKILHHMPLTLKKRLKRLSLKSFPYDPTCLGEEGLKWLTLDARFFSTLESLNLSEGLNLSGVKLERLGKLMAAIAPLREINLDGALEFRGRGITSVTSEEIIATFSAQTNLTNLSMVHNYLTVKEAGGIIGKLAGLTTLHLGYNFENDLESLPRLFESLGRLSQLTALHLPSIKLGNMPKAMESCIAFLGQKSPDIKDDGHPALTTVEGHAALTALDLSENQLTGEQLTALVSAFPVSLRVVNIGGRYRENFYEWVDVFSIVKRLEKMTTLEKLTITPKSCVDRDYYRERFKNEMGRGIRINFY